MPRRRLMLLISGLVLSVTVVVIWANSGQRKHYQHGDVVDGRHSQVNNHECQLVTDQKQWNDIWRRHCGDNETNQAIETLPDIDFSRYMVVAVFLGDISQCTGITVQSITRRQTDDHLDIRYRPDWYSAEAEPTEDLVDYLANDRREHAATPFGFIIVRRVATVSLFEDVQALKDAGPEYKLQTELSMNTPVIKLEPR